MYVYNSKYQDIVIVALDLFFRQLAEYPSLDTKNSASVTRSISILQFANYIFLQI